MCFKRNVFSQRSIVGYRNNFIINNYHVMGDSFCTDWCILYLQVELGNLPE